MKNKKEVTLNEVLQRVYDYENLETICLRQGTCCRVACPQMKYSEAINIIDEIWSEWSKEDIKKLIIKSVEYFFSDSLVKPCPLLGENGLCRVYPKRPLNCRLYGLWPKNSWEDRVAMFSKSTQLPIDKLPLNTQCSAVRRKPYPCDCDDNERKECEKCRGSGYIDRPPLTVELISTIFEKLDEVDLLIGITEEQIAESWNYRTLHDWILLRFWGEDTLAVWTEILLTSSVEQKTELLKEFKSQVEKMEGLC